MRIGIFGGSFSPVHAGHLKLAQAALSELNLDRVIFVPAKENPLKGEPALPEKVRIRLLRAALKKVACFELSLCELRRGGASYTVDTLRYFKKKYKSATLYFLAGADSAQSLTRWKAWSEIPKLCRFVILSRPGYRVKKLPAGVLHLPFDAVDISSTKLRNSIQPKTRRTPSNSIRK